MKIIIGCVLLYIIVVFVSAFVMRIIWNEGFKGTKHEETWKKALTRFAIVYFFVGLFLMLIFMFFSLFL